MSKRNEKRDLLREMREAAVRFYHRLSVNDRINLKGNDEWTTIHGDDDFSYMSVGGFMWLRDVAHAGLNVAVYTQWLPQPIYEYV